MLYLAYLLSVVSRIKADEIGFYFLFLFLTVFLLDIMKTKEIQLAWRQVFLILFNFLEIVSTQTGRNKDPYLCAHFSQSSSSRCLFRKVPGVQKGTWLCGLTAFICIEARKNLTSGLERIFFPPFKL